MGNNENLTSIRGHATQDHELEGLRQTWEKTPPEIQEYLLGLLDNDDASIVRGAFNEFPDAVVYFMQRAVVCGIREAVLRHVDTLSTDDPDDRPYFNPDDDNPTRDAG